MIEYGRNADGHYYGTLKPTAEMASKENRRLRRSTFQSEGVRTTHDDFFFSAVLALSFLTTRRGVRYPRGHAL
jgi:hypothetical protein